MRFNLPKEVSFSKEQRPYGWVYIFRHTQLGRLGRIVLQGRTDGRTQVSCEIAGDSNDPMTERRAAVFKPLGEKIADEILRITSRAITNRYTLTYKPFGTMQRSCTKIDAM